LYLLLLHLLLVLLLLYVQVKRLRAAGVHMSAAGQCISMSI
jgi:hypothetical protein